jgi:transposase
MPSTVDRSDNPAVLREQFIALSAKRDAIREQKVKLQHLIAQFQRALCGPRTERVDYVQLQLSLEDIEISHAVSETERNGSEAKLLRAQREPATRNRGALPKNLPGNDVVLEPDDNTCPLLGSDARDRRGGVGDTRRRAGAISWQARPASASGLPSLRKCRGRSTCAGTPIGGGMPSEALLKFACHVPAYPQQQMLAGQGIVLDRATLAPWMGSTTWWLKSLSHCSTL